MTEVLLAYHGDVTLKEKVLAQLADHRAQDQIVQGFYWDPTLHRGCAVGCLTHQRVDGGHDQFPGLWGIPTPLAHLMDVIFESLDHDLAPYWPHRIMSAIPVGADLHLVWPRYAIWLLSDGLHEYEFASPESKAVTDVAVLYRRVVDGESPSAGVWSAARTAARRAALVDGVWAGLLDRAAHAVEAVEQPWAVQRAAEFSSAETAQRAADEFVRLCETAPVFTGTAV